MADEYPVDDNWIRHTGAMGITFSLSEPNYVEFHGGKKHGMPIKFQFNALIKVANVSWNFSKTKKQCKKY